jgi:hypothetical protein
LVPPGSTESVAYALVLREEQGAQRGTSKESPVRKQKTDADPAASHFDGADAPVRSLSEDRLGRRAFAQALAAEVIAAPAARGYVMGLTDPGGAARRRSST